MATSAGLLHCPLVVWANNIFKENSSIDSIADLADGVFLNEIMMEIDPTYFTLTRVHQSVYGDVNLRMQNLDTLVKHLKSYYQEKLQQLVLMRMPNVVSVAQDPQSDEAAEELNKILLLMLGCAVQCENKELFIERIKEMDLEVQKALVEYIQQITDSPENVLTFRVNELAEFSTEQLLLYTENMFYQMRLLVEERDEFIGMISHLSRERDVLLQDNRSRMQRTLSPPPSPAVSHSKESPAIHANKEKIRLLTEEIEEKNVALSELREELLAGKKNLEFLRQQNKTLSQDARWVKAYRDEIDAMKTKADKVDRLETDNARFKEKLRDLDYHKKRSEELKEQNELLYETRVVLEEQLAGLHAKEERIEFLEEENKKLKTHIHHLAEERQFDQMRLKEVMEENAQLILDKQNSLAQVASFSSELDLLRGKKSPGSTTLASECSESSSVEVLRMQRENHQLRKSLEELKNFRQRISELEAENTELHSKAMEGKSAVFALSDDLVKIKAKKQQQEHDLNKLRAIVKRQEEDIKTSEENVLNLSGELKNKGDALVHMEEQNLLQFQLSEEKMKDVASLYERVKENESEISNLVKQAEEKEEKIAELTRLSQSKEEKLAGLNVAVVDREEKISDLTEQVKEKEDVIVKVNQKIRDREERIAELSESVESRDRRLQTLEKRLNEATEDQNRTEELLRNQRKRVTELENKIEDVLSQSKKSEDHLRRKDDEISELENRVEESVKQKTRTDENLRRKEKEVHEIKNRLEKITEENVRLAEELKFKEQKVQSLQKRVEELLLSLDESSEALNKNIREKEKENKALERRIEELIETVQKLEKIKLVVKEKEEKIETLNQSFDGKERLFQELESQLEEAKGESKKLEHVVKLKDKKIEALESSLAEAENTSTVQQDDRLVEMKRNAEGKDNRIIELESRLDDVTLANSKLQQSLKIREQKITELETQIEDIENLAAEKNRLTQSLDHKTKKLLDLETRLEEVSSDKQRLQLSAEQKSGKIRSLENKVVELEESLGSTHLLHQNIKQKDEKVNALNLVMQEREVKFAELENRLEDAQAQNHRLVHSSKMKEEKIIALEGRLEQLDELVSESKKLSQALQVKDEKIKALESKLEECEELSLHNTKLTEQLKHRENKMTRLQERLYEVEDAVNINAKLNQTVKTKEEKIANLQTRVNELEEVLDNKEKEFRKDKLKTQERIKMLEKRLEEYVEEREGKIHDLQSKLEGSVNRYRQLDMTIGEKEMMIAELQAKLIEAQETSREIRKLNHIMKTKDARIENLETKLEILESHLAGQQSEISDKDEKIDTLQKRLDETLNLNTKLDQSVRKKEEGIRTLEKTLQTNEKREEDLEMLLDSRSEKLSEYKKRVLELEDSLEKKDDKLGELQKRLDDLRSAATADARLSSSLKEKDVKIAEMEERVKELTSTFGQVDKLEKAKSELEQTVLSLETKLEKSESQKRRLDHSLKQKEVKMEDLEKRMAEMEASRDDKNQSLNTALKQKDSKLALMTQNLQQQESDNMTMEAKLEEVTAQANKLSRLVEQREDQLRSLKTRLEEAVHQNNKMTHAAELRDDKIKTLEKRLQESYKEQQKLTETLESYDKKAERDKSQKPKGNSSQTIIFKPADTTRAGQNTVEMLAIADKRIAELNDEIRMLEKQSVTVSAQNEAMSVRNAQLEIENESLKNELKNARADYAAIQADMTDVRDYYHQIDMAASKMGHRCEMLAQLNATLEEENKALVEQVNKLVEQNQDLLVKSLEDKDQFMDDERAFSDRIYSLQRQKERLEEQVDLANKALAETSKPKKKPNILSRVMRKAGLKKKRDEISKAKRNSVQLLRVDNSPFVEEFETSHAASNSDESQGYLVAAPFSRRDETESLGSRESSTSGESRGAAKTLLSSSLISAQSDVVLRRPREMSSYISTPALSDMDDVKNVRLRSATHDVSAFRARQVRSEIFNESDWTPGRLPRPRSLDALDKLPSSSSTLTPGDVDSREAIVNDDEITTSSRYLQKPGMRPNNSGSPSNLRKLIWARSSPNISPVPPRKEYPVPLRPPSPSSPASSRRSVSPRSSPVLSRRFHEQPMNSSPRISLVPAKEDMSSPFEGNSRASSVPNSKSQSLDMEPVRERPTGLPRSNISVQVIASTNNIEKGTSQSQKATPFQEDELKRFSAEMIQKSPHPDVRVLPQTATGSPYHERQLSGSSENQGDSAPHVSRGLQRQRSLSGGKNGVKRTEPSRDQPTFSPHIQHVRERSLSGERKDRPLVAQPVQAGEAYGRDSDEPVLERNQGIRSSQRQGAQFVAPPVPVRQSVPVTAHYVTPVTAPTSLTGSAVYVDATGLDLCTTHGHRGDLSSSSVYAVVRDKRGDERVISGSFGTPTSRDSSTLSGDNNVSRRGYAPPDSGSPVMGSATPSSSSMSRTVVGSDSSPSSLSYSFARTGSMRRNALPPSSVEGKPSSFEERNENRNDARVHISASVRQTPEEDGSNNGVSSVRARILEIEHPSPKSSRAPPNVTSQFGDDDDDDDARSVMSQNSQDCSPSLRRLRKARKAGKDKEIFFDSLPPSEPSSTASGRRSGGDERPRTRPAASNQGEGKRSSVWYEYGCV